MKKLVLSASILALTVGLNSVTAQTTAELYNFSNQNQLGKTARVSAMAGAYTSLGADLSSLLINPAGLAMFTNSE
ncbi:MAG: transporter, partial [Rikenellaceae bacterium]